MRDSALALKFSTCFETSVTELVFDDSANLFFRSKTLNRLRVSSSTWETFTESVMQGINAAAEYTGYLLPPPPLLFTLALIWRWLWRLATGR